ncbi:acyltransferase family protein [Falsiroseomonas sp. E2-1-a20]|uniref:acyltransferase family protein n=1 Tax=Falsiroseomonas sp. E2-1-a20 TaxID=3239300 RepID=UPI003F3BC0E5
MKLATPHAAPRPPARANATFSANLDAWRFILIVLVVLNHVLIMQEDVRAEGSALERGMVALTRAAVPALSVLSGYLLASSRRVRLLDLVGRKARSLILPFLVWNTAAVLLLLAANEVWHFWPDWDLARQSTYRLVNSLTAFHGAPGNAPLYFLRDLFLCFLAFTLLRRVVATPAGYSLVFALVLGNYAFGLDGRIILRDTIPLFFLIGIGLHLFPAVLAACARWTLPLAIGALAVLPAWAFGGTWWGEPSLLEIGTLTVFAALVVGLAQRLRPEAWLSDWGRGYSFMIFLSHWWTLRLLDQGLRAVGAPDAVFDALAAPLAVLVGIVLAQLVTLLPGSVAAAVSGGRVAPGRAWWPRLHEARS